MITKTTKALWRWGMRLAVAAFLICTTVLFVWAFQSRTLPDLDVWHEPLDGELEAEDFSGDLSFAEYLEKEDALFSELEEEVYREGGNADSIPHRYTAGSPSDPNRMFDRNWNRTTVLAPEGEITCGAVLLHGLTDGPYSCKAIGEILQARGCYTLCLRMPGHGTTPGALADVHWEDWLASMKMGVRHVREKIGPGSELYVGGYSTGGSIALMYSIAALEEDSLQKPARVFLLGPPIRVHPLARLTKAHRLLSWSSFFEKFKWLGVQLEFDPFKYNSFPKNGGVQSFLLSRELVRELRRIRNDDIKDLPPVVTFQSVVDATVLTPAVVNDLYMPMSKNGSELVLFDVNRYSAMQEFMRDRGREILDDIDKEQSLPFRYTLITNVSSETRDVQMQVREAGEAATGAPVELGLLWPQQVYSLSHVALPFRPDDPVYGFQVPADDADHHFRLGAATPRGERRLLQIPMDLFMRLRSNPFFDVVEERIIAHLQADGN